MCENAKSFVFLVDMQKTINPPMRIILPVVFWVFTVALTAAFSPRAQTDRFVGVWLVAGDETNADVRSEAERALRERYASRYAGRLENDDFRYLIALPSDSEDHEDLARELRGLFPGWTTRPATNDEYQQIDDELRK